MQENVRKSAPEGEEKEREGLCTSMSLAAVEGGGKRERGKEKTRLPQHDLQNALSPWRLLSALSLRSKVVAQPAASGVGGGGGEWEGVYGQGEGEMEKNKNKKKVDRGC